MLKFGTVYMFRLYAAISRPFLQSLNKLYIEMRGPGIATDYGLDGPGIQSRWGRDFSHTSIPALRLTRPPVQ
jgi:hypothetical protein